MGDVEDIQKELYKARHHLKAARDIAREEGWTNDEGYALKILVRCADALDDSLQKRFIEGAYEYEPAYEVMYLLDIDD